MFGGLEGGREGYFMTLSKARLYTIDWRDDRYMIKWKGLGSKSMLSASLIITIWSVLRLRM
jgi:hypothetical protein